jgi:hypothetical protein
MNRHLTIYLLLALLLWQAPAYAARAYQISQNPSPAVFTMGDTQPLTFTITNANTGGNVGERIYRVRFRLNSGGSVFDPATAAPAGWTITSFSTTQINMQANSWNDAIATNSALAFTLVLDLGTASTDLTESMRDIRAYYTTTTTGPPFNNAGSVSKSGSAAGSWQLKSLRLSMQITDLSNNPINTLIAGNGFQLVLSVTNVSSATQSNIVSVNNPPSRTVTGTVTLNNPGPVYSPNPLTLTPGASGTITYTYTTASGDSGTVYFTAYVRNNLNNATSASAVSNTLSIGSFVATLSATTSPAANCTYLGGNMTLTMLLTNKFSYSITGITPSITPPPSVTLVSGPTPVPPFTGTLAAGATNVAAYTWTYQFSGGTSGSYYSFSGSASGTASGGGGGPRTTPVTTSNNIKRGGFDPAVFPSSTNAASTNLELKWTLQNNGCADVNQVSITIPAGWTLAGGNDSYSLIGQANPPNPGNSSIENVWLVSGAYPTITFQPPPSPPNYVFPLASPAKTGEFRLLFSQTPPGATASDFALQITDTTGASVTRTTTVTVNPFGSGTANQSQTKSWHEEYR